MEDIADAEEEKPTHPVMADAAFSRIRSIPSDLLPQELMEDVEKAEEEPLTDPAEQHRVIICSESSYVSSILLAQELMEDVEEAEEPPPADPGKANAACNFSSQSKADPAKADMISNTAS